MATDRDNIALAELNKQRRKLFNIVNNLRGLIDIPSFYHYTNANGLIGILSKSEIWCTRWDYLNDTSEFLYIHELIENNLKDFEEEKDFVSIIRNINGFILENKKAPNRIDESINLYFASFCKKPDALNMWSRYSKMGSADGYCMQFDYKNIFTAKGYDIAVSPVIYERYEQDKLIKELLSILFKLYQTTLSYPILKDDKYGIIATLFDDILSESGYLFKHGSFAEEEEIRVALRYHPKSKRYKKLDINLRNANGYIIPYIPMKFDKNNLQNVIISPVLDPEIAVRGVTAARGLYGYSFAINTSRIPYRNI